MAKNASKSSGKAPVKPTGQKTGARTGIGVKGEIGKGDVKTYLRSAITEHAATLKREKMLDLIYMNRGLGVGFMKTFIQQFEAAYDRSKQDNLAKSEKDTVYGAPRSERPRLKKVSLETIQKNRRKK